MKELIDINFFYWFIPLIILIFAYLCWDMFLSDQRKPKYRRDENGYVQFYYRRYSCWLDFPIWKDNNEVRYVIVYDNFRDIKCKLTYIGPGRAKWKLKFDDWDPISTDYITKYVRQIYPEFKNSEQLWQLYNLYINKENTILNKLVSQNYNFIAYENNE